jgi:hypothetical protein
VRESLLSAGGPGERQKKAVQLKFVSWQKGDHDADRVS